MKKKIKNFTIAGLILLTACTAQSTTNIEQPVISTKAPEYTNTPVSTAIIAPTETPIPTETKTPEPTFTPTPDIISLPYKLDFEDDTMRGLTIDFGAESAKIIKDESGNKVLDIQFGTQAGFQGSFGPKDINNFDLTFRTRFLKIPSPNQPIVEFNIDETYDVFPVGVFGGFGLMEKKPDGSGSKAVLLYMKNIKPNTWYKIHIVSQGKKINVAIDDGKPLSAQINEITKANLGIQMMYPGPANIQIDDIELVQAGQ